MPLAEPSRQVRFAPAARSSDPWLGTFAGRMRYFRRAWDESRGDEYDAWGTSTWYFEVGDDGYPLRQIEVYEHGVVLKYDRSLPDDVFGGLGNQALDLDEFRAFEISAEVFDAAWFQLVRRTPAG